MTSTVPGAGYLSLPPRATSREKQVSFLSKARAEGKR